MASRIRSERDLPEFAARSSSAARRASSSWMSVWRRAIGHIMAWPRRHGEDELTLEEGVAA